MRKARAAALGGSAAALAGLKRMRSRRGAEASARRQGAAGGKGGRARRRPWRSGVCAARWRHDRDRAAAVAQDADRGCRSDGPQPWLLNVRNGVIDPGMVAAPHRAEDLITKFADVEYRGPITRARTGSAPSSRSPVSASRRVPEEVVRLLRHRRHQRTGLRGALGRRLQRQVNDPEHRERRAWRLRRHPRRLNCWRRQAPTAARRTRPASPTCGASAW